MHLRRTILSLALATTVACGGYSKETVSMYREHVGMRVPNQQRLLALATDEAVERLDFKALAGRRVVVEMAGIFPHTRADVLDYIQGQVEGKLARDGAIVSSAASLLIAPPAAEGEAAAAPEGGALTFSEDAEYRVVIGVSWAGVDTHDRKSVNQGLLLRQVGLGVGGLVTGIALGSSDDPTAAGVGSIVGGLAVLGAVGWYIFERPTLHTYRLLGRVRLSVQAVPLQGGLQAFSTVGEGQTELLIDPTAEEGYILQ